MSDKLFIILFDFSETLNPAAANSSKSIRCHPDPLHCPHPQPLFTNIQFCKHRFVFLCVLDFRPHVNVISDHPKQPLLLPGVKIHRYCASVFVC